MKFLQFLAEHIFIVRLVCRAIVKMDSSGIRPFYACKAAPAAEPFGFRLRRIGRCQPMFFP